MTPRTLETVDREINSIDEEIKERRKALLEKKKERRSLLRQERDQLRYVVGGLILGKVEEFKELYPGLLDSLYERADTRDKIKFVRAGLIDENEARLKEKNKQECQESVLALDSHDGMEGLSESDSKSLAKILEYLRSPGSKVQRRIYGRENEYKVYTGPNQEMRVSNELAAYLRDKENYSE